MTRDTLRSETGRILEGLLELLAIAVIGPPIVCCVVSALLALIGIVVPWLGLAAIAAIVCGLLGAGVLVRRAAPPDELGAPPPVLPPIRRPRAVAERRRDHHD